MASPRSLSDVQRRLSSKMATLFSVGRRATALTGRRNERDVLDRLIDAVGAGESSALVLRGEPGVGNAPGSLKQQGQAGTGAGSSCARWAFGMVRHSPQPSGTSAQALTIR
jgi:hypothetical protein